MTAEVQSGADVLARIKPQLKEVHTELCMRPDLIEAHEEAEAYLTECRMEDAGSGRLSDGGMSAKTKKAAQKVQAIEAEIQENVILFKLRALPQDKWRTLTEQHPPRKGNDMDFYTGYNRDAVTDAGIRLSLYDPEFDDASWAEFMSVCNPSEWTELRTAFNLANQAVVSPPKSELASRLLAKRGTTSRQPAAGE